MTSIVLVFFVFSFLGFFVFVWGWGGVGGGGGRSYTPPTTAYRCVGFMGRLAYHKSGGDM